MPVRPKTNPQNLLGCRTDRKEPREDDAENGLSQRLVEEKEDGEKEESEEDIMCQPCGKGDMEEEGEEGREAKKVRTPTRVSKVEREQHELTHTPFRQWCEFCVMGRGKNEAHMKKAAREDEEEESAAVPRVSMDYFFLSKEDEKASENPMIVMVDDKTGEKYARAVGQKGLKKPDGESMDWLVKDMSKELKAWGHGGGPDGHIIAKSDGEHSITSVISALAKYHGGRMVPEKSAKGESQSNGRAEEAGKTVRGFARVLKFQLEAKAGVKLDELEEVSLWMIRWAAMMASRYLVGKDGKTAHERRRGRKCRIGTVPFGEAVMYKELNKERKSSMDTDWQAGVWLGHTRDSNEVLIGTRNGVVRAYAVIRKAEGERWDADLLRNMRGTPQQPDPTKPGLHIPIRITFDPPDGGVLDEAVPLRKERGVRRLRITKRMLDRYGFTQDCEGCRCQRAGLEEQRVHSEACRARIEAEMEGDEDGRRRKERQDERMNSRLAEDLERQDAGDDAVMREKPSGGDDGEVEEIDEDATESVQESPTNEDESMMVKALRWISGEGSHGERMRKEMRRMNEALQVDVAEIFSPPRVTAEAANWGFRTGESMDLTTGWNFNFPADRQRAWKYLEEYKPKLVIGSPCCTAFSQLQQLNPDTAEKRRKWKEGCRHIRFMTQIYAYQMEAGRWFLHEHPAQATSWGRREVMELQQANGIITCTADQCMYGLQTTVREKELAPARKRTKFMTNSVCLADELRRKCDRSHLHQHLVGGRAEAAAKYPRELCRAICNGLMEEMRRSQAGLKKLFSLKISDKVSLNNISKACEEQEQDEQAWDDISGEQLDGKAVVQARRKELGYIEDKKVWRKIRRSEAVRRGWKVVRTRWIDTNKGDWENPDIRSRLVAKEFNNGEEDGLFAATPPLEALRMLVSDAATVSGCKGQDKVIMINDVARAFFEAPVRRVLCVELPQEAVEEGEAEEMVGLLQMSLYGTRDAANNFQMEVGRFMSGSGLSKASTTLAFTTTLLGA